MKSVKVSNKAPTQKTVFNSWGPLDVSSWVWLYITGEGLAAGSIASAPTKGKPIDKREGTQCL